MKSCRSNPPPSFDLTGKVALVTGGSRGLGREMVAGFAQAGADVVIASRDAARLRRLRGRDHGRDRAARAAGYGVHVGHWDELDGLVEAAYDAFGRVDVLVNNAGMSPLYDSVDTRHRGPVRQGDRGEPEGPVPARRAGRHPDGGGRRAGRSSTSAAPPPSGRAPDVLPYAAAKAGLNALTAGLARAFGPTVRCNAIMAGTFLTDVSKAWDQDRFSERSRGFALQRGARARARSSAPRCTWPATRPATRPAP